MGRGRRSKWVPFAVSGGFRWLTHVAGGPRHRSRHPGVPGSGRGLGHAGGPGSPQATTLALASSLGVSPRLPRTPSAVGGGGPPPGRAVPTPRGASGASGSEAEAGSSTGRRHRRIVPGVDEYDKHGRRIGPGLRGVSPYAPRGSTPRAEVRGAGGRGEEGGAGHVAPREHREHRQHRGREVVREQRGRDGVAAVSPVGREVCLCAHVSVSLSCCCCVLLVLLTFLLMLLLFVFVLFLQTCCYCLCCSCVDH